MNKKTLILFFSAVASASAAAGDFAGRVVAVHDGDTLTVLTPDHHQVKVRLAEIDAPECGQPWSVRSKRVLSELVYGQNVTVRPHGESYNRVVGWVTVDGASTDIDGAMIDAGAAWVFPRYQVRAELTQIQATSRGAQRGLWSLPDVDQVPPWEWRKTHEKPVNCGQ